MIRLIYNVESKCAGKSLQRLGISIFLLLCLPFIGCGANSESHFSSGERQASFTIVDVADHDRNLFTQGFEIADGYFYESAGLYGQSRIIRYLPSGEIDAQFQLPSNEFAEGLSIQGDRIALLTWQNRKVYFLEKGSLQPVSTESIASEGWGAAFIGDRLAISNGSDVITFYQLAPFRPFSQIKVKGFNRSWQKINELEFAKGLLWANIWQENLIIAIDPESGEVVNLFDLTAIVEKNTKKPFHESLNGIAYDSQRDAFWVTGKLWASRHLVKFDLNQ